MRTLLSILLVFVFYTLEAQNGPLKNGLSDKKLPGTLGFTYVLDTRKPDSVRIRVVYVFSGSPAEKAGITINTLISVVNDIRLARQNPTQVAELIKGDAGTNVRLTLLQGLFENKKEVTLIRAEKKIPPVLVLYNQGVTAYQQGAYLQAFRYWKKAGDYPEALYYLAALYAGVAPLPDSKDPAYYRKREQLKALENKDSARACINLLLGNGYSGAAFLLYQNCLLLDGNGFYRDREKYYQDNFTGVANYWLYEAAKNNNVKAQEELVDLITDGSTTRGFSHDPAEASYWLTRAVAGGSDKEAQLRIKINNMPAFDPHLIRFEDVKNMISIAHLYNENKFNYYGLNSICSYGIRGFRTGIYNEFTFGGGQEINWTSYGIRTLATGKRIFEAASADMKQAFATGFSDIEWYTLEDYNRKKPEQSLMARFTATEKDGKTYKMELGLVLALQGDGQYYLEMFYKSQLE
jgi:hypothetical protein